MFEKTKLTNHVQRNFHYYYYYTHSKAFRRYVTSCKLSQATTSALLDATYKKQTKLLLRISELLFTQRQSGLSVITQSFIFPSTQCHSLSHSSLSSHPHSVTLCHTVLYLSIHTVSLSVITQTFSFPFTPFHSLPSHSLAYLKSPFTQCHSLLSHSPYLLFHTVSLCHLTVLCLSIHTVSLFHHTVFHLPIHTVSLSVITQSFIFPSTLFNSLSSYIFFPVHTMSLCHHSPSSSHSQSVTLCHHTVIHFPIYTV